MKSTIVPVLLVLSAAITPASSAHPSRLAKQREPPCPQGLSCDNSPHVPQSQPISYLGNPLACLGPVPEIPLIPSNEYFVYLK